MPSNNKLRSQTYISLVFYLLYLNQQLTHMRAVEIEHGPATTYIKSVPLYRLMSKCGATTHAVLRQHIR
jgi:hypothetical protein